MRKAIVLAILLMLATVCVPAHAESTTRGNYTTPSPYLTEILNKNEYVYHSHDVDKEKRFQRGAGLDFVTFESKYVDMSTEYRYNHETKVHTVMSVAKINLFKLFNKLKN